MKKKVSLNKKLVETKHKFIDKLKPCKYSLTKLELKRQIFSNLDHRDQIARATEIPLCLILYSSDYHFRYLICKCMKQLDWPKLDRVYLKTHAEHRWKQELNRPTIFESLPSNGTVTVFQQSDLNSAHILGLKHWRKHLSVSSKPSKGLHLCFGRSNPMRAQVWTHHGMHQSAIVLVRCVPGSSLLPPPYWKAIRPWGWGCISTSTHVLFCLLYKHTNDDVFDGFPKISEDFPKLLRMPDERFRTFSEDYRRLPTFSEDNRGRCEDASIIHQQI